MNGGRYRREDEREEGKQVERGREGRREGGRGERTREKRGGR